MRGGCPPARGPFPGRGHRRQRRRAAHGTFLPDKPSPSATAGVTAPPGARDRCGPISAGLPFLPPSQSGRSPPPRVTRRHWRPVSEGRRATAAAPRLGGRARLDGSRGAPGRRAGLPASPRLRRPVRPFPQQRFSSQRPASKDTPRNAVGLRRMGTEA